MSTSFDASDESRLNGIACSVGKIVSDRNLGNMVRRICMLRPYQCDWTRLCTVATDSGIVQKQKLA